MKKLLALVLALVMLLSLAACNGGTNESQNESQSESQNESQSESTDVPEKKTDGYEIALVTDVGNIDDKSFNQGTWEGVVEYAEANNITYAYYRPSEDSTEARVESITAAIEKGAKTVVCPGYLFEDAVYEVQNTYPDVNFLLIDGEPHTPDYKTYETKPNTHCILYKEEQAGYLAGYAAVSDGYSKLGFLGGAAVPAVIRYGYGFVQGANDAAKALEVEEAVSIKYWYCGGFAPSDDIQTKMASWYADGTEVIFSCGGGIYLSATAAAEAADEKVIGVDVDQSAESDTIITSAMKELKTSVIDSLTALYNNGGKWSEELAGKTAKLGAAENCVGLPTAEASWRFDFFTVDEYKDLFEKIKSGEITVSDDTANPPEVDITVDYQS